MKRKFHNMNPLFYKNRYADAIICTKRGAREQWFFAFYGHPKISADHTIRSGIFDSDGNLVLPDGTKTDVSLFENTKLIDIENMPVVYNSPEGTTCRLLEVSPTMPPRVAICTFELDKAETATYYCSSFYAGEWSLSKPIAKAGEFLAPECMDGSQTYVPGMAFYYGVGNADFHPVHPAYINTDRIFLARCDEENRYVESYVSTDNGKSYVLEQTVKKIAKSESIKIWRPTVPVYAQDNLQLYWHEGIYSAHTGGWHCDAVMYCDFDN